MAMLTTIRNRSHVFLWALLILFLLSMSVGGLVGGANIIDQLLGRVNPAEAIGSAPRFNIGFIITTPIA